MVLKTADNKLMTIRIGPERVLLAADLRSPPDRSFKSNTLHRRAKRNWLHWCYPIATAALLSFVSRTDVPPETDVL